MERVTLGAPGIYETKEVPLRALTQERMDVCGFVGVAPRGPAAREPVFLASWAPAPCAAGAVTVPAPPVAVESWDEYVLRFGAFEGPGLLPYAVASFFENGGRRAYVVRTIHTYVAPEDETKNATGVGRARLPGVTAAGGGPVYVRARNEGRWGNALTATLTFTRRSLPLAASNIGLTRLVLPSDVDLPIGGRVAVDLGAGVRELRSIVDVSTEWHPSEGIQIRVASFDLPTSAAGHGIDVIEGELAVDDGAGRTELHTALGFGALHPRFLGRVLCEESTLLYPDDDPTTTWVEDDLGVDATLAPVRTAAFAGGEDRYADVVPDDHFDPTWVEGDECPGRGVHAFMDLSDLSLLAVPDLYSPIAIPDVELVVDIPGFAGPEFAPCVDPGPPAPQAPPLPALTGLALDPELPGDREAIIALQQRLVDIADQRASFVVLLDVPPRLHHRQILDWRARFGSAYAAAYHPWLEVARRDDRAARLVRVNPSAVAAGIIARQEARFGIPQGPANVLGVSVVDVDERVPPARHDQLHQANVNVFLMERDGVRLTAARTLSRDPRYRQLSVRRLVTMLKRVLERQMQWSVFEPNNQHLRAAVRHMLRTLLRQLFRLNAFSGAREEEAFFVRCDETLNDRTSLDLGRLVAEVGVAPAEPLEFIVLQIARDADGTLRIET
jgi:hypothetical protein